MAYIFCVPRNPLAQLIISRLKRFSVACVDGKHRFTLWEAWPRNLLGWSSKYPPWEIDTENSRFTLVWEMIYTKWWNVWYLYWRVGWFNQRIMQKKNFDGSQRQNMGHRCFLKQEVHGSQSLGPLDLQFLNPSSMRIPWHPNSHSPGKRHPSRHHGCFNNWRSHGHPWRLDGLGPCLETNLTSRFQWYVHPLYIYIYILYPILNQQSGDPSRSFKKNCGPRNESYTLQIRVSPW